MWNELSLFLVNKRFLKRVRTIGKTNVMRDSVEIKWEKNHRLPESRNVRAHTYRSKWRTCQKRASLEHAQPKHEFNRPDWTGPNALFQTFIHASSDDLDAFSGRRVGVFGFRDVCHLILFLTLKLPDARPQRLIDLNRCPSAFIQG